MHHLQFLLQAASPETFGYTLALAHLVLTWPVSHYIRSDVARSYVTDVHSAASQPKDLDFSLV
jgi:hypothetical protein